MFIWKVQQPCLQDKSTVHLHVPKKLTDLLGQGQSIDCWTVLVSPSVWDCPKFCILQVSISKVFTISCRVKLCEDFSMFQLCVWPQWPQKLRNHVQVYWNIMMMMEQLTGWRAVLWKVGPRLMGRFQQFHYKSVPQRLLISFGFRAAVYRSIYEWTGSRSLFLWSQCIFLITFKH